LEAGITLATQEEFSLRQAKLHVNVPLPPKPAVEGADEVEGMDLSSATATGQQWTRANVRCFRVSPRSNKQRDGPVGAGRPTGNAVTRVYNGHAYEKMELENPPTDTSELISLPVMSWKRFAKDLYDGRIEQLCILLDCERMTSKAEELIQLLTGSPTEIDDTLSGKTKQERFNEQSCKILREHMDVLSDGTPAEEVSRRDSGYCRGIKQAGLWTGRRNAHGNEPLRGR
ncbi:reverse transcriptase, partial [Phytophthora megakarya]